MQSLSKALKWSTIFTITFGCLLMTVFQKEFWPFSSYPMFNFRFDKEDPSVFALVGVKKEAQLRLELLNQKVLGPVRKGYLNRYCRQKIENQELDCLKTSLEYWARRYKKYEAELPPAAQGFHTLLLIEKKSNTELGRIELHGEEVQ